MHAKRRSRGTPPKRPARETSSIVIVRTLLISSFRCSEKKLFSLYDSRYARVHPQTDRGNGKAVHPLPILAVESNLGGTCLSTFFSLFCRISAGRAATS